MARKLSSCLGKLKARQQELLALRYKEEFSIEEVAFKTGKSIAASYRALSRTRGAPRDCLKFDLSSLQDKSLGKVSLQLTQMESPYGYSSFITDCEFTVYGLIDGASDQYDFEKIVWDNAPANVTESGDGVVAEQVVELGNFTIAKGLQSGEVVLENADLKQAIESDRNGLLTLIIVRNTKELRMEGLVHTFAGNHTPLAEPPRLVIELE